jgi:eukaryotic-like serine/threonine-protein kinase
MSGEELGPGNLRDRLRACRQAGLPGIPIGELLGYVRAVADALDHQPGQDMAHRDLKPDNIVILKDHFKQSPSVQLPPSTNRWTPAYMAPEVWRAKPATQSAQYSLAACYVELRCGRVPFSGQDVTEIMRAHIEQPPDLTQLPEAERQVLLRALAKDPLQRYPNCLTFAQELEQAVRNAAQD